MLRLDEVQAGYGRVTVLHGVSLVLEAGEILCLMGRNGAGKTTLLRAIMGLVPVGAGAITLRGSRLDRLPAHGMAAAGLGYVPQGRRLFAGLSVAENLGIGLMAGGGDEALRDEVLGLFPRLAARLGQRAETLSGGEQQMLALARALCLRPRVLLLDEPTEGLQPSMIAAIREVVAAKRAEGVAVLLVEQRLDAVLPVADRVAFIETGRMGPVMAAEALRADRSVADRYLGV
ncbi:branched-chain amino acid transport system ATP-binding protein [Roseovarius sp. MBR-78]|uniref:ABC transporter ATP-binding protein n=1 Tax=Roseovarius sp. MBR-78 TaxID=3156460 RepID=UPI003394AA58